MQPNGRPGQKEMEITPMGGKEVLIEDIVGQKGPKKEAKKFMAMLENRELVNYYGLDIPNMAFFGPPGTGKTLLTQAMAYSCINSIEDTLFASLNLQSFATPFINETSNNFDKYMQKIKEEIEGESPFRHFVIFMDEYDSIGRSRGSSLHGEDDKLVNAINSYMDGERKIDGVNYIIASNFKDLVDSAQRDRFGIHANFKLFDTNDDKTKLFEVHQEKINRKNENDIFEKIDYSPLVKKLKGEMSGRDVRDITNRTVQNKLFNMINSKKTIEDDLLINYKDFEDTVDVYLNERKGKKLMGFQLN